METVLAPEFDTARSSSPSLLKSAIAIEEGPVLASVVAIFRTGAGLGYATGSQTTLDCPPPGLGLTTLTQPVPGAARSVAVSDAESCELEIDCVMRGVPFQYTAEPGTKPVPFTVRVSPGAPG